MAKAKKDGKISGMEAVRRSVRKLGYDAKTQDVHDDIWTDHQMDLSNNKISAYKSTIRREAGLTRTRAGKSGGRPVSTAALRIEDVQAVKDLVGRLGAGKVRELLDVFH
jgi:hypothetical protein